MSSTAPQPAYVAIVFKHAEPTADFSCSTEVELPGRHTQEGAWAALRRMLDGPEAADYVGGDVRPA